MKSRIILPDIRINELQITTLVWTIKCIAFAFHVSVVYFAITSFLDGYYQMSTFSQIIDLMLLLSAKISLIKYSLLRIRNISTSTYEHEWIQRGLTLYKSLQELFS